MRGVTRALEVKAIWRKCGSRTFARALVTSALEGQTLYRDALRMLGISKWETFHDFGQVVGAAV